MKALVWTDGGSRGNPGPSATGWVIQLPERNERGGSHIGIKTNNEAEYIAVVQALTALAGHFKRVLITEVVVHSDSALVVGQLSKGWKVNVPHLKPLRDQALELVRLFPKVMFVQIPREENREADSIVNAVLDGRWIDGSK